MEGLSAQGGPGVIAGAGARHHSGGNIMERDVVCGMQVDPAKAAGKSDYNGKTYYFCSNGCKVKFDADPSKYAK
jgi:Cu+-exporting ATPase